MKHVSRKYLPAVAAGFIAAAAWGWSAVAQNAAVPQLSGHWGRTNFNLEEPPSGPGPTVNTMRKRDGTIDDDLARVGNYTNPILRPEAAAVLKQRGEYSQTGLSIPDMHNQCWSEPPPFTLTIELEMRLLQTKDEVVIVYVNGQSTRHVRLNAQHPAYLKPTWLGDSVGHYEGDTLVVDTVGVKTGPFSTLDRYGTPFSEKIHVVERYHLIDGKTAVEAVRKHRGTFTKADVTPKFDGYGAEIDFAPAKGLQVEVTVDDPGTFTKPWSGLVTYLPEDGWPEMVCAENTLELTGPPRKVPVADKPDF
jgi:hypothetical protein